MQIQIAYCIFRTEPIVVLRDRGSRSSTSAANFHFGTSPSCASDFAASVSAPCRYSASSVISPSTASVPPPPKYPGLTGLTPQSNIDTEPAVNDNLCPSVKSAHSPSFNPSNYFFIVQQNPCTQVIPRSLFSNVT